MKKLSYVFGIGLLLATTFAQAADIAVVNVAAIFQKMPEREKVANQLNEEFKDRIAELKKMEAELKSSIEKFQATSSKMKEAERAKMEKSINDKRSAFSAKAQAFEQDNNRRQMEERNKLLAKIQTAVQGIAQKAKYSIVIDVSATAYVDPAIDITEEVMKQVK